MSFCHKLCAHCRHFCLLRLHTVLLAPVLRTSCTFAVPAFSCLCSVSTQLSPLILTVDLARSPSVHWASLLPVTFESYKEGRTILMITRHLKLRITNSPVLEIYCFCKFLEATAKHLGVFPFVKYHATLRQVT